MVFRDYFIFAIDKYSKKRRLWTETAMTSAVVACSEGMPIRESARKYNVPASTLFRRVRKIVEMGCKPGPNLVLLKTSYQIACTLLKWLTWDLDFPAKRSCD